MLLKQKIMFMPKWLMEWLQVNHYDVETFLKKEIEINGNDYRRLMLANVGLKEVYVKNLHRHAPLGIEKIIGCLFETFNVADFSVDPILYSHINTEAIVNFKDKTNSEIITSEFVKLTPIQQATDIIYHYVVDLCYCDDNYIVFTIESDNSENPADADVTSLDKVMMTLARYCSFEQITKTELFRIWCSCLHETLK